MADPDLEHTGGDHDERLIALDPWERDWIFQAARDAQRLLGTVAGVNQTTTAKRLDDLMHKMRPRVSQRQARP